MPTRRLFSRLPSLAAAVVVVVMLLIGAAAPFAAAGAVEAPTTAAVDGSCPTAIFSAPTIACTPGPAGDAYCSEMFGALSSVACGENAICTAILAGILLEERLGSACIADLSAQTNPVICNNFEGGSCVGWCQKGVVGLYNAGDPGLVPACVTGTYPYRCNCAPEQPPSSPTPSPAPTPSPTPESTPSPTPEPTPLMTTPTPAPTAGLCDAVACSVPAWLGAVNINACTDIELVYPLCNNNAVRGAPCRFTAYDGPANGTCADIAAAIVASNQPLPACFVGTCEPRADAAGDAPPLICRPTCQYGAAPDAPFNCSALPYNADPCAPPPTPPTSPPPTPSPTPSPSSPPPTLPGNATAAERSTASIVVGVVVPSLTLCVSMAACAVLVHRHRLNDRRAARLIVRLRRQSSSSSYRRPAAAVAATQR